MANEGQQTAPAAGTSADPGNMGVDELAAMLNQSSAQPSPGGEDASAAEQGRNAQTDATAAAGSEEPEPAAGGSESEPDDETLLEAAEAESDEGEEPEGAQAAGQEPRGVRKLQKRVNKLTAMLGRANELIAQLQQQGAKKEEPRGREEPEAATDGSLFKEHPEVLALQRQIDAAAGALRWAMDNPQGGDLTNDRGEVLRSYTAEQAQAVHANALRQLAGLEGRKAAMVAHLTAQTDAQRVQHMTLARQLYPWLANKDAPEFKEAVEVLKQMPGLMQRPDYHLIVGRYVEGAKVERAKAGKKSMAGAAPAPRATPQPGSAAAAPPRGDVLTAKLKAAQKRFEESGSEDDMKEWLALQSTARSQRAA